MEVKWQRLKAKLNEIKEEFYKAINDADFIKEKEAELYGIDGAGEGFRYNNELKKFSFFTVILAKICYNKKKTLN